MEGDIIIKCLLIFVIAIRASIGKDCISRDFGNDGTVCVCNKTYCDTTPKIEKLDSKSYQVFSSTKSGLRFKKTIGTFINSAPGFSSLKTTVNVKETYQKIIGFGGAFTDSFGINLDNLADPDLQNLLIRSYFSEDGIEYNIARVPIGGTDYSTRGYSYCDTIVEDRTLSHFNLTEEDFKYKIPYIQQALNLTPDTLLFAAAWIAPKWMKTNGAYSGGGIKEDLYDVWANYFIKFLDAYSNENITFWGISTGNEPSLALVAAPIPSNKWLPEQMIKWVAGALGPTIRASSKYNNTKIMLLDDQRIFIPWYIDSVFTNDSVKNYVDIIAVHWYLDFLAPASNLDKLYKEYPDKIIMGTEACIDSTQRGKDPPVMLGSWKRGELYASSIIQDLNHYVTSWTDWNMALNLTGGPTFIDNLTDAPIIVNAKAGEFYKQPTYYALGHFSKFIPRDSQRIDLEGNLLVKATAFLRPDGGIVIVLANTLDTDQEFNIVDVTRGRITLTLEAHSFNTVVYY